MRFSVIIVLAVLLKLSFVHTISFANDVVPKANNQNLELKVNYPPFDLSSPRSTMNYFLKTMKGFKLGDAAGIDLAIRTLSLDQLDDSTKKTTARLVAKNLVNTLDRIEYIEIDKVPLKMDSNKWVYRKTTVEWEGEQFDVEIAIEKNSNGNWKFTNKTANSIFYYKQSLKDQNVVKGVRELRDWKEAIKSKMPAWTGGRTFIILDGQWLGLFVIIFLSLSLRFFLQYYLDKIISKLFAENNIFFNEKAKNSMSFPIGLLTISGIWSLGVRLLEFNHKVLSVLLRMGYVGFTIGCVLCVYLFVDILKIYLQKIADDSENKFDDILVPLVTKTLKTFVILVGIIFIGNSLTLDMKSIIAGMGIGGIAFALAAKDTISNIFGSLTVLLDRPFRIGDWVKIDDTVEGIIEEVGLRSTRIRTFYDSQITLPNGKLTNAHIDNYGQRTYRRLSTKLGIEYSTRPEKVEAFCEGIRQLIIKHPLTRKDSFQVYFNSFGNSALEILVYVFWKVPDWSSELNEKHRFLIDILRLGNTMDINFAFPTQTLHISQIEKESEPLEDKPLNQEIQDATKLSQKFSQQTLTYKEARSSERNMQGKE